MRAHEHDGQRRLGRAAGRPWWVTSTSWSGSGWGAPAPGSTLALDRYSAGDRAVVLVRGELDIAAAAELEAYVSRTPLAGRSLLELDLAGVPWAGSSGLSALLSVRRWCDLHGVDLVLSAVQASVWRAVQATGLEGVLGAEPAVAHPPSAEDLVLF